MTNLQAKRRLQSCRFDPVAFEVKSKLLTSFLVNDALGIKSKVAFS